MLWPLWLIFVFFSLVAVVADWLFAHRNATAARGKVAGDVPPEINWPGQTVPSNISGRHILTCKAAIGQCLGQRAGGTSPAALPQCKNSMFDLSKI